MSLYNSRRASYMVAEGASFLTSLYASVAHLQDTRSFKLPSFIKFVYSYENLREDFVQQHIYSKILS